MKKIIIAIAAIWLSGCTYAQKDQVSALFDKYNGTEGFTVVNISGDMLNMFTTAEAKRRDTVFSSRLTDIRILAVEKSCDKPVQVDFKKEIIDKLDKSIYKEMVSVKKHGEDVLILMRENGERISEILIIAGGSENNAVIQLKGDMLVSEMTDVVSGMNGMDHLKLLENK